MPHTFPLTLGPKHHFFGYYGINPWHLTQKHHLALETDFHEYRPEAGDVASVGLVNRDTHEFSACASTSAFNLQQGSMMHWINAGLGEEFTYNDWEEDRLVSRAVNLQTRCTRTIEGAIAAVSPSAPVGIGLNFARMAHCRAVVGYANEWDSEVIAAQPEDDGLWLLDLCNGHARLLLSISEVVGASGNPDIIGGRTWFNHVLFNTDGSRLLFFCRVRQGRYFLTSLWTVDPDGSRLACQIPFGPKTSHFAWRDTEHILISSSVLGDMQFLEFTDGRRDFRPFGEGLLPRDGHASFSPDGRWVVCDTSPQGPERLAELMLYDTIEHKKHTLGKYHAALQSTGDIRCDLHPRWSPDGRCVTFDSVHEGHRQIYLIDVSEIVNP